MNHKLFICQLQILIKVFVWNVLYFRVLQNCDGEMTDQSLSDQFHFDVTRSTLYGYIEQLTLKKDHIFDVNQLLLKVNPIVCYAGRKA